MNPNNPGLITRNDTLEEVAAMLERVAKDVETSTHEARHARQFAVRVRAMMYHQG